MYSKELHTLTKGTKNIRQCEEGVLTNDQHRNYVSTTHEIQYVERQKNISHAKHAKVLNTVKRTKNTEKKGKEQNKTEKHKKKKKVLTKQNTYKGKKEKKRIT